MLLILKENSIIQSIMKPKETTNKEREDQPKGVNEILDEQIATANHEYKRSDIRLFISSLSAGMEVGFSVFLIGILYSIFHGQIAQPYLHVLLAIAYPVGFIFVIIGRSELFTEHTTLAILPVLNGTASIKSLIQLWGVILSGNLIGGYIFSGFLVTFGPAMGIIPVETFSHLAHSFVEIPLFVVLISSVVAGWLMGLLSWLVASSQETISRIFMIILVTGIIGIAGLHHSIVGSIEVFTGMLVDSNIKVSDYLRFESIAILGNAIGGVVFVGIIKFGQRQNKVDTK